ncbi:MAG: LysM peptidoglycan-binding domain-containing protein [Candidatus Aureabacteria bacterium]|nr:LysM peptidoglycan-binding domain-containing protein [Candidatus Auribacterota bacterium]
MIPPRPCRRLSIAPRRTRSIRIAVALVFALPALLGGGCGGREEIGAEGNSLTYHIGMGKSLYQRGDYPGAVRMYEKAIGMDQRCAEAYLQLGIIYDDNLKDKKQALVCYRMFLALEPDSMMAEMVKEWAVEIEKGLPPATPRLPPPPRSSPTLRAEKSRKSSPTPVSPRSLPAASPASAAAARYTVKDGDTLARIAIAYYGDRNAWKTIFNANREVLEKPNALRPGVVLTIPPVTGRR